MKKNIILIAFIFGISIASARLGLFFGIGFFTNTGKNSKPLKSVFATETGAEYADVSQKGSAMFLDENARFTMSEGTISNHTTKYGGAIYISNGATFTMTGGTITGCTARYGGAIYVASGGTCIIEGGTITGNSATFSPSIYVEKGANLVVGGNAIIDNNTFGDYYETRWNFYVDEVLYKSLVFDFIRDGGPDLSQINPENPINGWFLDKNYVKTLNKAASTDEGTIKLMLSSNDFYAKSATMDKLIMNSSGIKLKEDATGEVVFPSNYNYTTIADTAFQDREITKVYLSDTIRTMSGAVGRCPNLTEIVFTDCVTSVGFLFQDMPTFERIYIPDSVTECAIINVNTGLSDASPDSESYELQVDKNNPTFDSRGNCNGVIETATNKLVVANCKTRIPSSVEIIGQGAFAFSTISKVTIPKSVKTIETNSFLNCIFLQKIFVVEENSKFDSRDNCNAIIETATNKLVFGCRNSVIPNSVVTIGERAFIQHTRLNNIIIPNSVTTIETEAFYNCSGNIFVPSSVKTLGRSAFYSNSTSDRDLHLYFEYASMPSGWDIYYCTLNWGYTLERFKTEMGISTLNARLGKFSGKALKSGFECNLKNINLFTLKTKEYIKNSTAKCCFLVDNYLSNDFHLLFK